MFRMYIGRCYSHIHIVQFVNVADNAADGAAGTGASSVLCASSLGARTVELPTSLSKHLPLSPGAPWGFIVHYHSFKSFSYHCMQEPSTEYLHRFSIFSLYMHNNSGTIIGYTEAPFTQLFLSPFLGQIKICLVC